MDREKVIKGLECCLGSNDCDVEQKEDCPYKGMCLCAMALRLDVFAMLKEQEAVKPITEHHLFLCPVCKNTLFREQKFCHECGKRIEWEGR